MLSVRPGWPLGKLASELTRVIDEFVVRNHPTDNAPFKHGPRSHVFGGEGHGERFSGPLGNSLDASRHHKDAERLLRVSETRSPAGEHDVRAQSSAWLKTSHIRP